MDNNTEYQADSTLNEMGLYDELRTIPRGWDLSSLMDTPNSSNNGKYRMDHSIENASGCEDGYYRSNKISISPENSTNFDEWYLGPYLDLVNDPDQMFWCAY